MGLCNLTKLLHKAIVTKWNKDLAFKDGIKHGPGTSVVFKKNSQILSNVLSRYKFRFIFKVVLVYDHEWFIEFPFINVSAPHNFS